MFACYNNKYKNGFLEDLEETKLYSFAINSLAPSSVNIRFHCSLGNTSNHLGNNFISMFGEGKYFQIWLFSSEP